MHTIPTGQQHVFRQTQGERGRTWQSARGVGGGAVLASKLWTNVTANATSDPLVEPLSLTAPTDRQTQSHRQQCLGWSSARRILQRFPSHCSINYSQVLQRVRPMKHSHVPTHRHNERNRLHISTTKFKISEDNWKKQGEIQGETRFLIKR